MAAGRTYGVEIRAAAPADAADLALLLSQLGYPMSARAAALRLEALARAPDSALMVAVGHAPVIGLVALHWCAMLQHDKPVARITTLVVDDRERGRGIGRMLVKSASQIARMAGCDVLELTTGLQREAAHAFCRSIGFTASSLRFSRSLRRRPSGPAAGDL
jgi:GNAT superfamily N-acetyltransferase